MKRYTRKIDDGKYEITDLTKATESLAKFEDLYDYVMKCELTIPEELAKLRLNGKEKSYRFKEIMGHKLMNASFIILLNRFGIK